MLSVVFILNSNSWLFMCYKLDLCDCGLIILSFKKCVFTFCWFLDDHFTSLLLSKYNLKPFRNNFHRITSSEWRGSQPCYHGGPRRPGGQLPSPLVPASSGGSALCKYRYQDYPSFFHFLKSFMQTKQKNITKHTFAKKNQLRNYA